jgi:hypothetical protein
MVETPEEKAEKERDEARKQWDGYRQLAGDLQSQRDALKAEIEGMKKTHVSRDIAERNAEIIKIAAWKELKKENDELKAKVEKLRAMASGQFSAMYNAVEKERNELKKELSIEKALNANHMKTVAALVADRASLEAKVASLEKQLESQQRANENMVGLTSPQTKLSAPISPSLPGAKKILGKRLARHNYSNSGDGKAGSPLRFITPCCGVPLESLVEHYPYKDPVLWECPKCGMQWAVNPFGIERVVNDENKTTRRTG